MKKSTLVIIALLVMHLLGGCAVRSNASAPSQPTSSKTTKISVWAAYWDTDGAAEEASRLGGKLESFMHFAAYFDAQDKLFVPEETTKLKEKIAENFGGESPWPDYLTFVNDKLLAQGGSSLKDSELLYRLLGTPEARKAHIADVIALAEAGGYNGIEIDYEAIRKDAALWAHFIGFITDLTAQTQQRGLLLRVVLEPGIAYDTLAFPKGPEYVIMCYNLYGAGTEPGPKANDKFLLELVEKTKNLPGKRNFALATGGYDFVEKKAAGITLKDAQALAIKLAAKPKRDGASQALCFSYQENGVTHTVWYADTTTITHWIKLLRGKGDFGISIWRMDYATDMGILVG